MELRFFPLLMLLCQQRAEGAQEAGRGQNQESWPRITIEITHTIWCPAWQWNLSRESSVHLQWTLASRALLAVHNHGVHFQRDSRGSHCCFLWKRSSDVYAHSGRATIKVWLLECHCQSCCHQLWNLLSQNESSVDERGVVSVEVSRLRSWMWPHSLLSLKLYLWLHRIWPNVSISLNVFMGCSAYVCIFNNRGSRLKWKNKVLFWHVANSISLGYLSSSLASVRNELKNIDLTCPLVYWIGGLCFC